MTFPWCLFWFLRSSFRLKIIDWLVENTECLYQVLKVLLFPFLMLYSVMWTRGTLNSPKFGDKQIRDIVTFGSHVALDIVIRNIILSVFDSVVVME